MEKCDNALTLGPAAAQLTGHMSGRGRQPSTGTALWTNQQHNSNTGAGGDEMNE